jgi:hypothetical protein
MPHFDRLSAWVLRGSGDIGLLGQVRKKSFNLQRTHFIRVTLVMKKNVALCPMEIHFFGRIRIVFDAYGSAQLVEKFFLGFGDANSDIGKSLF